MTTADRLRTFWGEREFDREGLASMATRYWEIGVFAALMLVALGLRLPGLADRAIHHDESLHMIYSWHLFEGRGYEHVPFMHGPFQYFGNALVFRLWPFGATDFSGRLLYALFGSALVGLPYFLRGYIGRKGAIIAAVFLALSPTLWYFSRFARNDIYMAVFTLAMVIVIWRYLKEQKEVLLFAVPLLLMLGFATKEVTFITVAIFLAYLEVQLTTDLVDQMRASRSMEPGEVVLAYVVLLPTAWIIVCLWPLLGEPRQRWSLTTMPPAGHLLIVMGTFSLPQFGPAVQKVPEVVGKIPAIGDSLASFPPIDALRDRNVDAEAWSMHPDERALRWVVLVVTLAGSAAVGLLWNPRIWAIGAAIFYIPYFLLYTTFFTNGGDFWNPSSDFWSVEGGGFWTGIWGSLDYWLSQHLVRRGNQPDYYYFVILPVYEFLPLVFALGGALFYALRGRLEQTLLTVSALLLVILFIGLPADTPVIGEYRIQASFVVVIAAVLLLSMDAFTKFLLFWTLATLFGITVAGEKMPWLTVHLAVPIALLAAKVLDDVLSTVGVEPGEAERPSRRARDRRRRMEPEPASAPNPLLLLILGGAFALLAAIVFQFAGPANPPSALAWLLSLGALGVVIWAGNSVSWRTAGQVAAVSLAAAFLAFTVRAGAMAAYDEGDPNGIPREMFIYAQGSPGLNVVLDNLEDLAFRPDGPGYDQKIVIDDTGNTWPWPWSLRKYRNLRYESFKEETFTPEPGSIVLISNQNQAKIEASLDQFQPGYAYTHMWWFREWDTYRDLELGSFLADFFRGHYFPAWRAYFIDRELKDPYPNHDMLAFFPKEFQPDVPPPPPTPETATAIPEESQTLIGGSGSGPGRFGQPADLAVDADGNLYVVDTLNHRVQRFAPDGTFIDAVGEPGAGEGQFLDPYKEDDYEVHDGPWGIAVDEEGNVYVADTWNHRIQKFSPELEFLLEWGAGELFGPRDIAIDDEGNVLVVDTGNKRIVKYTPDGEAIESHGQEGDGPGEFNEPSSISIAPDGDIYVADFWNRRIQHFDGAFGYMDEISVDTWGSQGVTDRAYIVALDDGRVLATDPANGRFIIFGEDGNEQAAWRFSAVPSRPVGIAVDPLGRAYVADGFTSEVRRVPLLALLP